MYCSCYLFKINNRLHFFTNISVKSTIVAQDKKYHIQDLKFGIICITIKQKIEFFFSLSTLSHTQKKYKIEHIHNVTLITNTYSHTLYFMKYLGNISSIPSCFLGTTCIVILTPGSTTYCVAHKKSIKIIISELKKH